MLKIKHIYEQRGNSDGYRILVDCIWPRGISKKEAQLDEWRKLHYQQSFAKIFMNKR